MNTVFVLLVLFLPPTDGLIAGWTKSYLTMADCQRAQNDVYQRAGRGRYALMIATCQEEQRK